MRGEKTYCGYRERCRSHLSSDPLFYCFEQSPIHLVLAIETWSADGSASAESCSVLVEAVVVVSPLHRLSPS